MYRLPSRSSALGRLLAAALSLTLLLTSGAGLGRTGVSELAVVVNPQLALEDISRERLRRIFMGDQQFWPSGKPVTLLVQHPNTQERGRGWGTSAVVRRAGCLTSRIARSRRDLQNVPENPCLKPRKSAPCASTFAPNRRLTSVDV